MKNLFLSAALFAASVVAVNAQESYKPEVGSFGVEVAISPLLGAVGLQQGLEFDNNIAGQFKVSYILNDKMAVRLGLGFGKSSSKEDNGEAGATLYREKRSQTSFSFLPGFTYSFDGTEKLTPYVGAELAIGTCSTKDVYEIGTVKRTYTNDGGTLFNTFGFHLFTGFNYFFAQNLYVGVEAGIGFETQKFKIEDEVVTGDPSWSFTKPTDKSSNSAFGFKASPILRLGWYF